MDDNRPSSHSLFETYDMEGSRKRARQSRSNGSFASLLLEGGCTAWGNDESGEYCVEDARKLRQTLDAALMFDDTLKSEFVAQLEEHLSSRDILHAALRPMAVTGNVDMGDSFVRVLLNVTSLQGSLSRMLLERLPELDDDKQLQQLILAQFRWLEQVVDSGELTRKLLEVMEVCPEWLQCEIITFLPEIMQQQDYQVALEVFDGLLDSDSVFVVPIMEAMANMELSEDMQAHMLDKVLSRLRSAEVDDLADIIKFLLQHMEGSNAVQVADTLRDTLHFVNRIDPRLTVPDYKQKGSADGAHSFEVKVLDALKTGLQLNDTAAVTFIKSIEAIKDPGAHKTIDLWLLLLFHAASHAKRKKVEFVVKKKLAEGWATAEWIEKGIVGHVGALGVLFPSLLCLAQQFTSSGQDVVRDAGVQLYCTLFKAFDQHHHRQDVIRCLHAHLGCQRGDEVSAALEVLSRLAVSHAPSLMSQQAFLANVLDHVHMYNTQQLRKVFGVFSELIVRCSEAHRDGTAGGGGSGGRTDARLEDEVHIMLRKCVSSSVEQYRCVGVVGMVSLASTWGDAHTTTTETPQHIESRCKAAHELLCACITHCSRNGPAYAFLWDEISTATRARSLHSSVLESILEQVWQEFEDKFAVDLVEGQLEEHVAQVQVGGVAVEGTPWLNLDGRQNPVALNILGLLANSNAPDRSPLVHLCALFRLLSGMNMALHGSMDAIDALLGCPLSLPPSHMCVTDKLERLPVGQQAVVIQGLVVAINWFRELVNAYSATLSAATHPSSGSMMEITMKLRQRVVNLVQLEALLDSCLPVVSPSIQLPNLRHPLKGFVTLQQTQGKTGGRGRPKGKGNAADEQDENVYGDGNIQQTTEQVGEGAAVKTPRDKHRVELLRPLFRPLLPACLEVLCSMGPQAEDLAAAAYLLAEANRNLKQLTRKVSRNPFGRGGSNQAEPCAWTADDVIPVIPRCCSTVRRLLDSAVKVANGDVSDEGVPVGAHGDVSLLRVVLPAAEAAVQGATAATAVMNELLCFLHHLLQWDVIITTGRKGVMHQLLTALSDTHTTQHTAGTAGELLTDDQVLSCCCAIVDYLDGVARGRAGECSIQHTLLMIQRDVVELCRRECGLRVDQEKVSSMQEKVSNGAESFLQHTWGHMDSMEAALFWKNHPVELADALQIYIRYSADPVDVIKQTASYRLTSVPRSMSGKKALECDTDFPSLSGATVCVWYKTMAAQLQAIWVVNMTAARKLHESGAAGVDCVEDLLQRCACCVSAFNAMVQLTKQHDKRMALHVAAAKFGSSFLDAFMRHLGLWQTHFNSIGDSFTLMVKEMQKATKVLNILCCEAKARREMALASKVPEVKRSLERFLLEMKAFFIKSVGQGGFWVGNLKHRDLSGAEVSSQMYPEDEDEDDDMMDYEGEDDGVGVEKDEAGEEGDAWAVDDKDEEEDEAPDS